MHYHFAGQQHDASGRYVSMPHKGRSETKKALSGFTIGLAVVLTVVVIGLVLRSFFTKDGVVAQKVPQRAVMQKIQEPADASSEIDGKYYGLCKKNSIRSVGDFRKIVRNDPVLATHFAGFDWDSARLGKQERDIWTFVSYRKGSEIKRTSKAVRLPKGDGFVTDGTRLVRTYCCNDYVLASSAPPAGPVERVDAPPRRVGKEPSSVDSAPLQLSSGAPDENAVQAIPEAFKSDPRYFDSPHFFSDPSYHSYSSSKNNHDHVVTPEPGTLVLMGIGIGAFGLSCLLHRKRTKVC